MRSPIRSPRRAPAGAAWLVLFSAAALGCAKHQPPPVPEARASRSALAAPAGPPAKNPWTRVRVGDWVRVESSGGSFYQRPVQVVVRLEAVAVSPGRVEVAVLPEANPVLPPEALAGGLAQVAVHPDRAFEPPVRQTGTVQLGDSELPAFCGGTHSLHVDDDVCVTEPWGPLTLVNGFLSRTRTQRYAPGETRSKVIAAGHDATAPAPPDGGWETIFGDEPVRYDGFGTERLEASSAILADGFRTATVADYEPWTPASSGEPSLTYQGKRWSQVGQHQVAQDLAATALSWADSWVRNARGSRAGADADAGG